MFSLLASHSKSEKPNEAGGSSGNTSWATEDSPPEYTIGDQQPITFYFDNDDMKSNIIYSPEMQPLYELYEEPPKAFGGRPPVHIYRLTPSPPGAGSQFEKTEIMFIRWNHIGRNSQITFVGGETVDLKDMFQRIQGFAQRS
ncbi:hypothetical protein DL93DRAFT_856289 [Clavulina sp. PMI_390]|nr:hypothetical protein DL93DRAFT_856289 [Clavulina sp. PMI_390]